MVKQPKGPPKPPTPKGSLHDFYIKRGMKEALKFEVHSGAPPPAAPSFLCNLTIAGLDCQSSTFAAQEFTGVGPSKRSSEHVASQKALAFLQSQNLLPQGPNVIPDLPESGAGVTANAGSPAQPSVKQEAVSEDDPSPEELRTWVITQLGGKEIEDLGPIELKDALESALQKNTELKASLQHDQHRRHRAMAVLLGIS